MQCMGYSGSNKTQGNLQMDATGQVHSVADQVCSHLQWSAVCLMLFFWVFQQDSETEVYSVLNKPHLEEKALRQRIDWG